MHGCLTLIDYTWRESDESECTSPLHKGGGHLKRRLERNAVRLQRAASLAACERRGRRSPTSGSGGSSIATRYGKKAQSPFGRPNVRRTMTVTDVYPPRQAPTYASWAQMHRPEFASVWYPFVHCRYRLQRDPDTGSILWNSESSSVCCTPRTLTEICIAYLIRDWPCTLPSTTTPIHPETNSIPFDGPAKPNRTFYRPDYIQLSVNLFERLLTEAIVQRDCSAISGLLANWPGTYLQVKRLIPKEDFPLTRGYLTKPIFVTSTAESADLASTGVLKGPSLLDAFIIGILSRQPICALQAIDVSGFEEDRRVSIELSRIPLLWMSPAKRNSDDVRQQIRGSLQMVIQDARFDRYFNRISTIYTLHEGHFCHGQVFDPVTISLDCNMSVDEVAFGLALQNLTPFRFQCNRLLMRRLPDLRLPVFNLIRLLDPLSITQFELEDPELGACSPSALSSALGWIASLRNLRACSLPSCIPPPRGVSASGVHLGRAPPNPTGFVANATIAACRLLNRSLVSLRHLQRLSLARCYLQGQLHILLGGISQPMEYLNLQDCCLSPEDIEFLAFSWRPLPGLYELNIARNNLSRVPEGTLAHLFWETCFSHNGHLTCLSLAYTCLQFDRLVWILRLFARDIRSRDISCEWPNATQNCPISSDDSDVEYVSSRCTLRVLCIQNFIPPTMEVSHRLVHLAISLPRLRLLHLYPAFYAFPGVSEKEQQRNRSQEVLQTNAYVRRRGRKGMEIR